jgi:hypothetical protein
MSYEHVKTYLQAFTLDKEITVHTERTDTVEHAAQAIGCEEKRREQSRPCISDELHGGGGIAEWHGETRRYEDKKRRDNGDIHVSQKQTDERLHGAVH